METIELKKELVRVSYYKDDQRILKLLGNLNPTVLQSLATPSLKQPSYFLIPSCAERR